MTNSIYRCGNCTTLTKIFTPSCVACDAPNSLSKAPKGTRMPRRRHFGGAPSPSGPSPLGGTLDLDDGEGDLGDNDGVEVEDDDYEEGTLADIVVEHPERVSFGMVGVNRVLGCNRGTKGPYGAMRGGAYMLKGRPGSGKTTLTLQICLWLVRRGHKVVYATGEQSLSDVAIVARAVGELSKKEQKRFIVLKTQDTDRVIAKVEEVKPILAVLDSVQMFKSKHTEGAAASEAQCHYLHKQFVVETCKRLGTISWLISQITKQGEFRGPMTLAHLVDADFIIEREGDDQDDESIQTRVLYALVKNRGGMAGIVARFLMTDLGLKGLKAKLKIKDSPKRKKRRSRRDD